MENPIIQTDLAQILNKLDGKLDKLETKFDEKFDKLETKFDEKFDKLDEKVDKLAIGQAEIKGDVKALDVKTEQLNTRVGNVEFAVRGILIGLAVVVLGGFAMFFWMSRRL